MNHFQEFEVFWANLDEISHPQSWKVTWDRFRKFSLFNGALVFVWNPLGQVMHNYHLVPREKSHPNLASYVKDIGS